jgi:signal peptidase II
VTTRARDFSIAGVWFLTDQATKVWAAQTLDGPITVVPGVFRLWLSRNTGALFGIMADWPATPRLLLLTALPAAAIVAITWMLLRTPPGDRLARLGLALILGGAAGNVLDRVLRGYVIDFLDVYWGFEPFATTLMDWFGTNRWPTFNVADTGLTCGAALLLIEILRRRTAERTDGASVSD